MDEPAKSQRMLETSILGGGGDDGGFKAVWLPTTSNYLSNLDLGELKKISIELGMNGAQIIPAFYLEKEVPVAVSDFVRADLLRLRSYHVNNLGVLQHYTSLLEANPRNPYIEDPKRGRIDLRSEIQHARSLVEPEEAYIESIVDTISREVCFDNSIVIEHSPPMADSILGILKTGSGVAIGSWMGVQAAEIWSSDHASIIMFAAVPAGIIVCGAAAGISEGLQSGLKERLIKLLNPPAQRRRK